MKLRKPRPDFKPTISAVEVVAAHEDQQDSDFNVHRDLPPEKLDELKAKAELFIEGDRQHFRDFAYLMIVCPQYRSEYDMEEVFISVKAEVEENKRLMKSKVTNAFHSVMHSAILLFPERREELGVDDELYDHYSECINTNLQRANDYNAVSFTFSRALLFPDREPESHLADNFFNRYLTYLRGCNDSLVFSKVAAELALLRPDRKKELGVDAGILATIKQDIPRSELDDMYTYERLFSLAVLSADEARITRGGVEIINHPPMEQTPELPQRKVA